MQYDKFQRPRIAKIYQHRIFSRPIDYLALVIQRAEKVRVILYSGTVDTGADCGGFRVEIQLDRFGIDINLNFITVWPNIVVVAI